MSETNATTRVLVTGASGYVGGHCVIQLLKQGYKVRGTIRSLRNERTVARLRALVPEASERLELVEADLTKDQGWPEAVAGCRYVLHVASPFPLDIPKDEDELVRPAVDGTRRVLEACAGTAGGVERVVLTSSVAAVAFGHRGRDGEVLTEKDWSVIERCTPYPKSKTLAERAAWEFVKSQSAGRRFELAVINPGFILGPVLDSAVGSSGTVIRRLMIRDLPACPAIGFAVVDVRDVASAHILAMTKPEAAGNRYICAGDHYWMQDLARELEREFGPLGYRIPTGRLPYWLMWIVARFDSTVRAALQFVGRREEVSHARLTSDLGWSPRPVRETLSDMGHSMIAHGVVPTTELYERSLSKRAA
ncbi:MAG: aldehyde reductase [Myxococcales bacterium]|nr:MAG: aldehyde reductase [Myxococcales bacterium]